ncbi:hypothetical protein, partial [Prosthecobacter sp.]|uniref:hypothetical protein n=1 Tax=Prosthecobacter sp. TaxID=1965333 RepID=UPI003783242A
MNKNLIQGTTMETRRQISLKSDSCPESRVVNEAVMSVEVSVSYPGRSGSLLQEELPLPRGGGKGTQKSAESIVAATLRCEGPKREEKTTSVMSMEPGVAATEPEMAPAAHRGGVRNTPGRGTAATKPAVVTDPGES